MSDASQLIAQQIAAAGITPGELTPVGSVTKTYVDTQDAALSTGIQSAAGAATAAQQTANTALTNANSAQGVAGTANSTANTAKSTADSALAAAGTAQQTANGAQTAAQTAQSRADAAYALAEQSEGAVNSFGSIGGVSADSPGDTLTFAAGSGMQVVPDPATNTITFATTGGGSGGTVPDGTLTQKGIVQLSSTAGTDETKAATPKLVKDAFDAGTRAASTTQAGRVQLNDTNTSTSTTQAATANASRVAYETASRLGSTTQVGQVQMYDGIDSTSTTLAATANAVRLASLTGGGSVQIGTTASVTYYVDGTAGLDTNNGTSTATAFKTVMKAINTLWDLCKGKLNHDCTIRVQASITYAEDVTISGFWGGGSLTIIGNYSGTTTRATVTSVSIAGCSCKLVDVRYFTITAPSVAGVSVVGCTNVNLQYLIINNGSLSTSSGVDVSASLVTVQVCTISYRYTAVVATNSSTVASSNSSGSNNTFGLQANLGATIAKNGSQPSGTTAESANSGGVIR